MNPLLELSPRLWVLPVVYGSGDFALEVRRRLRGQSFDCLALPLPPSFAGPVEDGVGLLPRITVALQAEPDLEGAYSLVPIDPCQGVIAALRHALEQGVDRAWIDLEVPSYEPPQIPLPDPFALKQLSLEKYLAALLPSLPAPPERSQRLERLRYMAYQLHCLELEYERVVFVCAAADWPWVRQAYRARAPFVQPYPTPELVQLCGVAEESVYFALGELPFLTHLYEHRRAELMGEKSLGVDGVKALLLEARDAWVYEQELARPWLTPQCLGLLLRYVRNLTLMEGRLAPDLYNLGLAAKQVVGDDFALVLIEVAREYPPQRMPSALEELRLGMGKLMDLDGQVRPFKDRLQGAPRQWRALPLRPQPPPPQQEGWAAQWDPYGQCSYPPEDRRIESFQQHVRAQARVLLGEQQARVEKFTASLKDGLDMRETLRNWHRGGLYVREIPPTRGQIEIAVLLFDSPARPDRYTWRTTWYAEHGEESTLCFYATPFIGNMVGPGIGQAVYGGCFFLYPPRPIPDVWADERFAFARTLEERLLAGALYHSAEARVALVAPHPPLAGWRQLARRFGRQLVYIPLKRFSPSTVDRLRRFHVLNTKEVRSYASRFIRDLR